MAVTGGSVSATDGLSRERETRAISTSLLQLPLTAPGRSCKDSDFHYARRTPRRKRHQIGRLGAWSKVGRRPFYTHCERYVLSQLTRARIMWPAAVIFFPCCCVELILLSSAASYTVHLTFLRRLFVTGGDTRLRPVWHLPGCGHRKNPLCVCCLTRWAPSSAL